MRLELAPLFVLCLVAVPGAAATKHSSGHVTLSQVGALKTGRVVSKAAARVEHIAKAAAAAVRIEHTRKATHAPAAALVEAAVSTSHITRKRTTGGAGVHLVKHATVSGSSSPTSSSHAKPTAVARKLLGTNRRGRYDMGTASMYAMADTSDAINRATSGEVSAAYATSVGTASTRYYHSSRYYGGRDSYYGW